MTNEALTAFTLGSGFIFLLFTLVLVIIHDRAHNRIETITSWLAMGFCCGFMLGLAKLANLI